MKSENKPAIIDCSFPNIVPINSVEEVIRQGHFTNLYSHINDRTVPLKPLIGAKTLHLVCFNRVVGETEYIELLRAEGQQPCRNAPQYLLGLMVAVPEDMIPKELANKDFIAAEPDNASSKFTDESGHCCFLFVDRYGGGRELSLTEVCRELDEYCASLSEDLVT